MVVVVVVVGVVGLVVVVVVVVLVPVMVMELNLLDTSIKVAIRSDTASCKGPGSVSTKSA